MRWNIAALALLTVAGCGKEDSRFSELASGEVAIIVPNDHKDYITVVDGENVYFPDSGARVIVVEDWQGLPKHEERDWESRRVRVRIQDGSYQGKACGIARIHLRLMPHS